MKKNLSCCQRVAGDIQKVDSFEICLEKNENVSDALLSALQATECLVDVTARCYNGTCTCSDICDELIIRMYKLTNHRNMPPVFSGVVLNYFEEGSNYDDRGETR